MKSISATILALLAIGNLHAESLTPLAGDNPPQTLQALWNGYDPSKEPLEIENLTEWTDEGITVRLVRYKIGVFKGTTSTMAAIYAFPKGGSKLPALLHLHGGGQSASLYGPIADAKNGYASLSINWGGNPIPVPNSVSPTNTWQGPQTDWGKLDATHPPKRNPVNHFTPNFKPDDFTLDAIESPRNSNWFLVLVAARRAITFLEQQPEVDPSRIAVYGHSMGGKLTTNLAAIDPRVKAAVPSCGGSGDIDTSLSEIPGGIKTPPNPIHDACISDNAHIPRITRPILWLSPTNDFHAIIEHMAWNWRSIPDPILRLSITPHRNHVHDNSHNLTQHLFFEQHLKKSFSFPKTPQLTLNTENTEGIPHLTATPDLSAPVKSVHIYYSIDPHPTTRFWRSANAVKTGDQWSAPAPLMSIDQPLFAYADVSYETPAIYQNIAHPPGSGNSDTYSISSRVITASPTLWKSENIRATDIPERMIDSGSDPWRDWSLSNWDHPPLWSAHTAKLKDPKWRGPDGAKLVFEIQSTSENTLAISITTNAWGVYDNKLPASDHVAIRNLKASPDWQTVSITLQDLTPSNPETSTPLANWRTVTDLRLSPTHNGGPDGRIHLTGKPWQGPRTIRNLRWEGGEYTTPLPVGSSLSPEDHQRQFNDAINKSLKSEKSG